MCKVFIIISGTHYLKICYVLMFGGRQKRLKGQKKLTLKNKCGCTVLKKEIQNRDKTDLPTESMLLKLKQKIGMKKKSQKFPERRGVGPLQQKKKKKKNNQKKNYDIGSQIFVLSAG